jgi:hypothetical protein
MEVQVWFGGEDTTGTFSGSGTTINGVTAEVNPLAPAKEIDRY